MPLITSNPNEDYLPSATYHCPITDKESSRAKTAGYKDTNEILSTFKTDDTFNLKNHQNSNREIKPFQLPLQTIHTWLPPVSNTMENETSFSAKDVVCKTEEEFKDIADMVPAMIWMSDADNKVVYVNKHWINFTGVNPAASLSEGWKELIHPTDFLENKDSFDEHFNLRLPVTITYRLQKGNGTYCWVQDNAIPRVDKSGRFSGYIGSIIDINEQKIKEQQLRFQATILENVSDVIVIGDLNFKILSANKVAEAFYGIEKENYLGKTFDEVVQLKHTVFSREQVIQHFKKFGYWKGEVYYNHHTGVTKHLLYTINFVFNEAGEKIGTMGVGTDITERKEVEVKLLKSEQFYRNLIADSLDAILVTNPDGKITFVSPSVTHILGYQAEEVTGKNVFQFVHPSDYTTAAEAFNNEVLSNAKLKFIVVRLLNEAGDWIWCMVRGHNLMHNPYVGGIAIYFYDDTSRKKASEALKESETRFRTLIRDLHLGVVLLDARGRITMSNKAISTTLAIHEESLIGQKISSIVTNTIYEDGKPLLSNCTPVVKAIKTKKPVNNVVLGVMCPNKQERLWLLTNTEPVLDSNGHITHIICSINDITERKKLEQKLLTKSIYQQRLLTQATIDGQEKERKEIGKELHDNIGQQLTTTKLFLDLAKTTADDNTNEMISLALKGISDVINEVRRMSRALVPPTLGDLGLIESINDLIDAIGRAQYLKIDFHYCDINESFISDNKKLMFFRIVQEQLNNIVKHAGAKQVTISLTDKDAHLILEVQDNGKGFDIKSVRKGLGLTNIKNRAELFGGKVDIISAPGNGCVLKVSVPDAFDEINSADK